MARRVVSCCSSLIFSAVFLVFGVLPMSSRGQCGRADVEVISCVDASRRDAEKVVLKVGGKPFYPIEIQVRLDKLRYYWGWDASARDAIVAQAAADGFNTVSIPIHWYEVEPKKDKFDWTVLDEYIGLSEKHHLKMEMLWFGQNSGGHVQWLGDVRKNPVHLRTPDYVLYSPAPESTATTSEFTIRRDRSAYTLDLTDARLRARETYVLGRVMQHIAARDAAHGSKHTVIGVQLDNEAGGGFPAPVVVSYLSDLGSAVKNSRYVVWTRLNCIQSLTVGRISANEALRSGAGTNIDFVGIDIYRNPSQSESAYIAKMPAALPDVRDNYRMIMECGADTADADVLRLAALYGDTAMDYYEMVGPDRHGLYDPDGTGGFVAHGTYVAGVRAVNKALAADIEDIATKAEGRGLFVHNWTGGSTEETKGARDIVFTPGTAGSQGLSIIHSDTELVLMNTGGGTFAFPTSLEVKSASTGHFDEHEAWIDEGKVPFTGKSISMAPGTTVRLIVAAGAR